MKKQRYQIAKTMAAAVLIAASWHASGQSADAIVNKLVQKGVRTQQEADDLRTEADKDFAKTFAAHSGMPGWTKNVTFSGDLRLRLDDMMLEDSLAKPAGCASAIACVTAASGARGIGPRSVSALVPVISARRTATAIRTATTRR